MRIALQAFVIASFVLAGAAARADEVILFKCFFDWKCDPNTKCDHAALDLRIRHNTDSNEAEFLGNHGSPLDKIGVHIGDRSVSFLAYQISGAVDVTTIALMDGEATHSSHRIGGITMKPEQYMGECVALPSSE
ncbi:hypothetical protein [Aliiruegeria sabulilitoris]|uniref:hypothetical protein n=1 Tax=Aliiruegeria sabulilitoris TaxID=1510458 RepID=UPI00082EFAF5|nr:hypothetical protein [Aliiruegeria sabulilitoris]NDR54857.1 hypothetical protein [Pseudoruegeria sp. M32A2M]